MTSSTISTDAIPDFYVIAYLDNIFYNDINAILSMLRTIFVCVCLAGAALYFVKDMNTIILLPIENMLKKIETITENPINAAIIQEKEAFVWHTLYSTNKDALKLMFASFVYLPVVQIAIWADKLI